MMKGKKLNTKIKASLPKPDTAGLLCLPQVGDMIQPPGKPEPRWRRRSFWRLSKRKNKTSDLSSQDSGNVCDSENDLPGKTTVFTDGSNSSGEGSTGVFRCDSVDNYLRREVEEENTSTFPRLNLKRQLSMGHTMRRKPPLKKGSSDPQGRNRSRDSPSPDKKTPKLEFLRQFPLKTSGSLISVLSDRSLDQDGYLADLDRKHSRDDSHWDLSPGAPMCLGQPRPREEAKKGILRQGFSTETNGTNHRPKRRSFAYTILNTRQEYTYCQVLEAVINPLGLPDPRPGFSPAELAEHVKEIFGIDDDTHKRCVRAVQHSKPTNVGLYVTVVEAKDLKAYGTNAVCDPYCVLQVRPPKGGTPKNSPRVSPKSSPWGSPRTSPTQVRRHSSLRTDGQAGMKETHVIRGSSNPTWNCDMEMAVIDLQTDDLHLSIWDESLTNGETEVTPPRQLTKNKHSLRNLFRHFHKISGDKADGCLGQVKINIKDIPALGCEKWYDLYEDSRQRRKTQGQCKVRLQLSTRHSSDSTESDQCTVEDFCQVMHKVYQHAAMLLPAHSSGQNNKPVLTELPAKSQMILSQFAVQNHFTELSRKIIELCVLLEIKSNSASPCDLSDPLLRSTIDSAASLCMKMQKVNLCHEVQGAGCGIREVASQTEISLLERNTIQYIEYIEEKITDDASFPRLFPPLEIKIEEIIQRIGVSKQLLGLVHKISKNDICDKFSNIIRDKIQADCLRWWNIRLQCIKSCDQDAIISEVKIFTGVVKEVIQHTTPSLALSHYFTDMKVKYEKCVTVLLEKKVACKAQELMLRIDDYQKRFLRYRSNIMDSSTVSQALYNSMRDYLNEIKAHFTMRDLFRITMTSYQDWFQQTVTYWLQTFREEGVRRVGKALDIEKDVVQVTEGVKYSNSAVDVVTIFHKITSEWKSIDFADADIALLGATKITELICSGVKLYLDKVEDILEHNGYYDFIINEQFDVTDQLCITLNNHVHVIQHLRELPALLRWDSVCQSMSVKYEDQAVGQRCLTTLERLTRTAQEEGKARGNVLLARICNLMEMDLENYTKKFTQCQPNKPSSVDALLDYLRTNLAVFHQKLDSFLMPSVIQDLWNRTLTVFSNTLMDGEQPDYYSRMNYHLESLFTYFLEVGLDKFVKECPSYCYLLDRLNLNTMSTENLMLSYYASLTEQLQSPKTYFGYLEVKVAYQLDPKSKVINDPKVKEQENNNSEEAIATLFVNVLRAKQLPGMNGAGEASNPFVTLSLCPVNHFPVSRNLRTSTVFGTVDPVFDLTYQYQGIPLSHIQAEGATVVLTVWHRDPVLPCHYYLGEVVVPIKSSPCLGSLQVIDDISASMCPLVRRTEPEDGAFKVLVERQKWDKLAREMVKQRRKDTGMTPDWPLCRPMAYLLNKMTGRRSEVKGQPKISGPLLYR